MTIWDSAMFHFNEVKPKFGEILVLKKIKISRMDSGEARKANVVPFQLNCNATSTGEISNAEVQTAVDCKVLDELEKEKMVGCVISFSATVLEKEEKIANLTIVKVKQRDDYTHSINFWKEINGWTENLCLLKPRMYCLFQGIKIKAGGQLTASIYSKINIFKI